MLHPRLLPPSPSLPPRKPALVTKMMPCHRYQAQGLFFEVPSVSWRDGCFNVALPKAMHAAALAKAAEVELTTELMLESRDAAFEFGTRDAGALAGLYRNHVR